MKYKPISKVLICLNTFGIKHTILSFPQKIHSLLTQGCYYWQVLASMSEHDLKDQHRNRSFCVVHMQRFYRNQNKARCFSEDAWTICKIQIKQFIFCHKQDFRLKPTSKQFHGLKTWGFLFVCLPSEWPTLYLVLNSRLQKEEHESHNIYIYHPSQIHVSLKCDEDEGA